MRLASSTSVAALTAALLASGTGTHAQVVPNVSPSNVNVLNLLAPFLSLNGTATGQTTLQQNLSGAVSINNNSPLSQRAQAISDKTIASPTATITLANGSTLKLGPADNLAGGLPPQQIQSGNNQPGTITPYQPVGGYGYGLGPIYQTGIRNSSATSGPLTNTYNLLVSAYNYTSADLGVAKNYFANGDSTNTQLQNGTLVEVTAVPPPGYTLPTYNGLPNRTNSVYDIAYGVTNTGNNQDVFGDSRPVQVAPTRIQTFDPTALTGLATNPSFPSGHTNYAFTDSILLAMLTPSLYQEQMARAADYANDRIVLGVHYPLDIIASRSFAAYDLAQAFTNPLYINNPTTTSGQAINLPALFVAAQTELSGYLSDQCGAAVATCANSSANLGNDPYAPSAATQATYQQRLTYGLPTLSFTQAPREAAPANGPDASILLAPLYGGSTAAALTIEPNGGSLGGLQTSTINQIIVDTETNALAAFYGTALSYWSRIDLYSAAGYFGNTTGTLTLAAADRLRTNVTVGSGSTVYGDGATITGNVNVGSGGTFGGGSATSAATTTIAGNLTQQAGSSYAVTGANNQFSLTRVSGTAAIGGSNLAVAVNGSFTPLTRIPILTAAGGVSGTFGSITFATPGYASLTTYDAQDAYLVLGRTSSFGSYGTTRNQVRVASAIGAAGQQVTSANGSLIVNALFADQYQSPALAQALLDSISGEGYTATQNAAFQSSAVFVSSIEDEQNAWRLPQTAGPAGITLTNGLPEGALGYADASQLPFPPIKGPAPVPVAPPRLWRAWGGGFGVSSTIDGNAPIGTARQTDDLYGGVVGVDYQVQPNILIGAAGSGTNADFSVSNRATNGTVTGGHGALYGTYAGLNGFYVQSTLAFSGFDNDVHRTAGVGALTEQERASFGSFEVRVRGELGERFAYGFSGVTPFVAVEYANLNSDGFTERNAATNLPGTLSLNVPGRTTESLPVFAGLRFDTTYLMGGNSVLRPFIQAAYIHEFDPSRNLVNNFVSLPGASFLVEGARPAEDAAQIKAGFDLSVGNGVALFANFDGEFSGVENVYGGKGGIKVAF